jgi:hypothetical protein
MMPPPADAALSIALAKGLEDAMFQRTLPP